MLGPEERDEIVVKGPPQNRVGLLGPKQSPMHGASEFGSIESEVHLEIIQYGVKLKNKERDTVEVRVVYLGFFLGPPLIRVE